MDQLEMLTFGMTLGDATPKQMLIKLTKFP